MNKKNLAAILGALTFVSTGATFLHFERGTGEVKTQYEFRYQGMPASYECFELGVSHGKVNPSYIQLSNGDKIFEGVLTSDDGKKIEIHGCSFLVDNKPL